MTKTFVTEIGGGVARAAQQLVDLRADPLGRQRLRPPAVGAQDGRPGAGHGVEQLGDPVLERASSASPSTARRSRRAAPRTRGPPSSASSSPSVGIAFLAGSEAPSRERAPPTRRPRRDAGGCRPSGAGRRPERLGRDRAHARGSGRRRHLVGRTWACSSPWRPRGPACPSSAPPRSARPASRPARGTSTWHSSWRSRRRAARSAACSATPSGTAGAARSWSGPASTRPAASRWSREASAPTPAGAASPSSSPRPSSRARPRCSTAQFVLWNLLASLGFAVSVAASTYGLGRIFTGTRLGDDIVTLRGGARRRRAGRRALRAVAVARRARPRGGRPGADALSAAGPGSARR